MALDLVKPVLAQVTAVPSPTTPASARPFVFTSSEAGTIGISGSPLGCTSPQSTPAAVAGTNTVNLGGILFAGVDTTTSGCAVTVTDAFGNVSDPLTIPAFIIDDTVPSVAISGAPALATAPYEVTITYSEPIAITGNPGVADISNVGVTVTNGDYTGKAATQGNLSPTVLGVLTATGIIKPTNDGPVTVVVNAGAGTDRVGTANQASSTVTTIFDATAPIATVSGNPAEASDPFEVVIGFSEPVLGFEDSDVLVGNGSFTRTFTSLDVTGTGGVDGVRGLITPTADGDVTVSVPADAVEDKANRNNPASNTVTTVFNGGPPSATFSSGATNVGLNPVSVNIGFSEDVTGFTLSDLSLSGLEASNLQSTGARTFTFDVVATTDGTGQITLPAGVVQDVLGLASVASDTFSLPVRASRPVFTLDSVVPRATGQVANFAISPSGSGVGGVTPTSAIDITGGVITSIFTGLFGGAPLGVQIIFEPTGGPVTISLPEGFRFEGEFGNGTAATGPVSIGTFTNTTTIVQISDLTGPDSGPLTATITLSEASTEFDVGDLFIENATAVLSGAGDTYTVVLTPVADGRVRLAVGANRFFSTSGKPNIASNFVSRMVDATPPTVSIGALSGPTDGDRSAQISLSEAATDFDVTDLSLSNVTATLSGSGDSYVVTLTPILDGVIGLSVAAGRFTDAAGNANLASNAVTGIAQGFGDGTAPEFTFAGVVPGSTPGRFVASFTAPPDGLATLVSLIDAVSITNGVINSRVRTGADLSVTFTPTSNSPVTLSLAAGLLARLGTGVPSPAQGPFDVGTYDVIGADVTLASDDSVVGAAGGAVTITFSEDAAGFALSDLSVTNATASALTGGPAVFSFVVIPDATGPVSVTLPAGRVTDPQGNGNTASNTLTLSADLTAPTVSIGALSGLANGEQTAVITLSEDATDFELDDLTLVNATATLIGAGSVYTATLTPLADGEVGL